MAKNLIIVESPAKTRTLRKFLGKDWELAASMGHIRDLVKKDMGLGADFDPRYEVLGEKKEVVQKLRRAADGADTVFLAPDPDREGEAIAWHIAQVIGKDPAAIRRVTFNEITRRAVLKALDNPGEIDHRKVDAQQARRILDRLMGFRLSPLLWEKVKQGLSAGRVQSVALKMVCDRQAEIDAFVAEEYWIISARLEASQPPPFEARLHRMDDKKAKVANGEQAETIVGELRQGRFVVRQVERKESKQRPAPPFITSRLQQEAARRLGFSVKRTMSVAQGLYEGREIGDRGSVGLITYMRTDSTRVADEALQAVRAYITSTHGDKALPSKPNRYRARKGAQEAHEAIRPTTFDLPPEAVKPYLKKDEHRLYKLIWDRFAASQMLPAIYDVTQVDIANGRYELRATGKILKRPGFLAVYKDAPARGDGGQKGDEILPPLQEGDELRLLELGSEQKFTQPPAQYSEATLVRALEENGIGRPSTYASILATLSDRDYVLKEKSRFRPTSLGVLVNQLLQTSFHDIINEGYTASLEEELDQIEEGKLAWKEALTRFDEKFRRDLAAAGEELPNVKRDGLPTEESCPECGASLMLRTGRFGTFLGCSNYPDCKYTRDPDTQPADADVSEDASQEVAPCEKCGRPMVLRRSRYGTFWGCSGYPECKNIRKTGPGREPPKPTGVPCPQCGEGEIQEKRSRRGKIFYSCSRYPDCEFALWNRPVPKRCPQCGAPFLVEKSSKKTGIRLLCHSKECDFQEPLVEAAKQG